MFRGVLRVCLDFWFSVCVVVLLGLEVVWVGCGLCLTVVGIGI